MQSQCLFLNDQMQMAVKLTPIAYALTQQSGNERFRTLVAIFGCYLKVFSDEPLPQDISRYVERLGELPDLGDKEMQDCLPLFRGILHYVRGEYPHVLKYYEQKLEVYGWKYRRFAMLLASCASQSAFYLRQYHLSLGINESSRRTAAPCRGPYALHVLDAASGFLPCSASGTWTPPSSIWTACSWHSTHGSTTRPPSAPSGASHSTII